MEYCSVHATSEDFESCRKIVEASMVKAGLKLTSQEIILLTKDIMETSAMMGGNYEEKSIQEVCENYIDSNFYPRFLKLHRKELGGSFFDSKKITMMILEDRCS